MANKHFLYFLVDNAESITSTGQVINQWVAIRVNNLLNELVQNETKKDYWVAGDTDSAYFRMSDLVEALGIKEKDEQEISEKLSELVDKVITPEINKYCDELSDYFNNLENKMVMEREVISPVAIFVAKKRYAMLVKDVEGFVYEDPVMQVVGLEVVRTNTPLWARQHLEHCYRLSLEGKEQEYYQYLKEVHRQVYELPIEDIAIPTGVNNIEKYSTPDGRSYIHRAPKHVKSAIVYNRLLDEHGLHHMEKITSGGNMKYVSLIQPNPLGEESIGFISYMPKEFGLDEFVDREEAYERGFKRPLKNFMDSIGWHVEEVVTLF